MKLRLSKDDNALYLRLNDHTIVESEEVESGVILDFDSEGNMVGIEILRLSERTTDELDKVLMETV